MYSIYATITAAICPLHYVFYGYDVDTQDGRWFIDGIYRYARKE
jgi:hypothetical protein